MMLAAGETRRIAIMFGNAANAVPLGGSVGGTPAGSTSLDVGSGSEVVTLNLQGNTAYLLADDASKATNVQIKGFGADDRILGFSALGAEASEMLAAVQTAMLGALPYTTLRDAIFTHPTVAEGLVGLFSAANITAAKS